MIDPKILAGTVSERTLRIYSDAWAIYINHVGAEFATDPAAFAGFKLHLVRNTDYAPTTINGLLIAVRMVIREAAARGEVANETYERFAALRGVSIQALKHRLKPNRTKISPGQMRTLCDQPDTSTAKGLRDRALLLTLATSGCRISEVTRLEVGAITTTDGGNWGFTISGKTDTEPRMVPISHEAKAAIDAWLKARPVRSSYIFTGWENSHMPSGRPISHVGARWVISQHAASAGLSNIKPHDFRRFVGTQLAKKNPRHAQRVLGHRSITTTMTYYVIDDVPFGCTDDLF